MLLALAGTLIGPLSGLITNRLFDYVDDVKKWTAKLPDAGKQTLVVILAGAIPFLNAKFGFSLPADACAVGVAADACIDSLLAQPSLQSIVAIALAFVLKGSKKK